MLKKLIKHFDMFAAPPLLRVKGESESTNLFGGVCSILFIILFAYMFFAALVDLFLLRSITATETITYKERDLNAISNFTIAFGLSHMDITSLTPYLTARAFTVDVDLPIQVETQIPLVPCTPEMWAQLQNAAEQFETLFFSQLYCPATDNLTIGGSMMDRKTKLIKFQISMCSNVTSPVPCESQENIEAFFGLMFSQNKYFIGQLFMMSTQFNIHQEKPTFKFVNLDSFWLTFSQTSGRESLLRIGTYEITTDVSFLPWVANQVETGHYVDSNIISTFAVVDQNQPYLESYISTSPSHRVIKRSYGKIDQVLSYVGGLFGIIIAFLGFFMMSFNEYRYELAVAEGAFSSSFEDQAKIGEAHMTFFKYVKYTIYDWVKTVFCGYKLDWPDCKRFEQAREEAIAQIDVQFLLKRIGQLEHANNMRISADEEELLGLTETLSLDRMKKKRKIMEYTEKIMHGRAGLTIDSINLVNKALEAVSKTDINIFSSSFLSYNGNIQKTLNDETIQMENVGRSLQTLEHQDSYELIESYLKNHQDYLREFNQEIPELDKQELQLENELINSFERLKEARRIKIIGRIPLPILQRLTKNKTHKTEEFFPIPEQQEFNQPNNTLPSLIRVKERKEKRKKGQKQ